MDKTLQYDKLRRRLTVTGNVSTRAQDTAILSNLRRRWDIELAGLCDSTLINYYDEFAASDKFGNNDAGFLDWIASQSENLSMVAGQYYFDRVGRIAGPMRLYASVYAPYEWYAEVRYGDGTMDKRYSSNRFTSGGKAYLGDEGFSDNDLVASASDDLPTIEQPVMTVYEVRKTTESGFHSTDAVKRVFVHKARAQAYMEQQEPREEIRQNEWLIVAVEVY